MKRRVMKPPPTHRLNETAEAIEQAIPLARKVVGAVDMAKVGVLYAGLKLISAAIVYGAEEIADAIRDNQSTGRQGRQGRKW